MKLRSATVLTFTVLPPFQTLSELEPRVTSRKDMAESDWLVVAQKNEHFLFAAPTLVDVRVNIGARHFG
jgi:hypothetical protein